MPNLNATPKQAEPYDNQRTAVLAAYSELGTWRGVGDEFDVSPALAWKVGRGLCESEQIAVKIGMKQATEPAPVCTECGVVHTYDCQHETPRRKPADEPPDMRTFACKLADDDFQMLLCAIESSGQSRRETLLAWARGQLGAGL